MEIHLSFDGGGLACPDTRDPDGTLTWAVKRYAVSLASFRDESRKFPMDLHRGAGGRRGLHPSYFSSYTHPSRWKAGESAGWTSDTAVGRAMHDTAVSISSW
jgi:hypothetical protein